MRLLSTLLNKLISQGTLCVIDHKGKLHTFAGKPAEPKVTIHIHDPKLYNRLVLKPDIAAAEAYMDGTLTFEDGASLLDFLTLMVMNTKNMTKHPVQNLVRRVRKSLKRLHEFNPIAKSRENASHHYDLTEELYRMFLDDDMQYSCGYFINPEKDTLEEAQIAKKRRIAAKLDLKDGMSVLDIGCGWGGMGLYLAQLADVKVTGIALAKEQLRVANARAEEMKLTGRVSFEYQDYREVTEKYDRIVSVGMIEHVGAQHLDEYFRSVQKLLKPGGRAVIHSIGRQNPPGTTNAFIRKYIFPGGYSPSISEAFASVERVGLWVDDCEVWRLHYYYTIMHWRERFLAHWDEALKLYDERFCRMWEFYLTGVALGFKYGTNMNFQLILSHLRDDVPITRDFIGKNERALKKRGL
ncbi:MAG: cyclopropane-fatty-acyl-phospholipid synthase family protein [Robiginitomaculum sp.]|nr:cyclopropane-fatty-acyl-phospholipid synthase family protein [Robiginitomaculum sp.]